MKPRGSKSEDKWASTFMREVPGQCANGPTGEDVGLPMGTNFNAGNGVVSREQLQRINAGMVVRILEYVRRDYPAYLGDFAAREALPALKPLVGVACLRRPQSPKDTLSNLGSNARERPESIDCQAAFPIRVSPPCQTAKATSPISRP